jgi:hypothetical protein
MSDDTPSPLNNVITIDDERIKSHLDRVVRGTVEETLNALLDAEADRMCNAQRDIGDSIVEHVAGVDDFEVAEATYRAAVARWPAARTPKRRDVPIAPRAPQQKKARRSCGRKHTSAPAFIIKLLIRTRRGVFRDV